MPALAAKPVIGIVGGIGSGKSTVADLFRQAGCAIVDADRIGHEVLTIPAVMDKLVRRFGREILAADGAIDRSALGKIVFDDPAKLEVLSAIVHPPMGARIAEQIAVARSKADVRGVVLDAAILFEAGWDRFCTHTVFVHADEHVRAARVAAQRGWDQSAWAARESAQISLDSKGAKCQYRIDNSSSLSRLQQQVQQLLPKILS